MRTQTLKRRMKLSVTYEEFQMIYNAILQYGNKRVPISPRLRVLKRDFDLAKGLSASLHDRGDQQAKGS